MDTRIIAATLLVGRLITIWFIFIVFKKQLSLLRSKHHVELRPLRKILFGLSFITIAGNIIPVVIDTMGIFGKGSFGLLLAYVYSNNITAILSAITLYVVYKISESTQSKDE